MKIYKKLLSLILICVIALGTVGIVNADMAFKDLLASHWGYAYVQTLVGDGTINGYADGTFRPEANVTRAEFVKMIGKTDIAFNTSFDDIAGHWAYDYIMYSNMDVEGSSFNPDVPITRNDVINLLYKRAGSPSAVAPSVITNQSTNKDAAAWAYAYGIMNGDDGLNLRLGDGVTRAEASALICRSRTIDYSKVKDFASTVDPQILKTVFNSFEVLDGYSEDKVYTKGEIAFYAMALAYETQYPTFDNLVVEFKVNRPYAFAYSILCNYVWGDEYHTEANYDAPATNLEAVTALTFAANLKTAVSLANNNVTDNYYTDINGKISDTMNVYATGAYKAGILVENGGNIYPNQTITGKSLALMLVQLDTLCGFATVDYLNVFTTISLDASISTDISNYPSNSGDYKYILSEIPNSVYQSPYINFDSSVASQKPVDSFASAFGYRDGIIRFLQNFALKLYDNGADVTVRYYPSMVVETDDGYIMKIGIKISGYEEGKSFDDIFPNIISGSKPAIDHSLDFIATISTEGKYNGFYIPVEKAVLTSIDYIF